MKRPRFLADGPRDALVDRSGQAATLGVAACLALALKAFYARADADALDFVLAPTTVLVEGATGLRFEREPGVGYLCRDAAYLIAPACAGLNFTIAAFTTLVLGFTPRHAPLPARAIRLVTFCALALTTTPFANATRITLDLTLGPPIALAIPGSLTASLPLLDPARLSRPELHRLEGIVVSLVFLWLLHAATGRVLDPGAPVHARILIPLTAYLAITLVVPLLNPLAPDGDRPDLRAHARVVLTASLLLAAACLTLESLRFHRRARRR